MKYYGKVLFNGVPASGLAVNLLDTDTGLSVWSGYTTGAGFFFADVPGHVSLVASVAGQFDMAGYSFPPMARSLQSISKERVVFVDGGGWIEVAEYSMVGSPPKAKDYGKLYKDILLPDGRVVDKAYALPLYAPFFIATSAALDIFSGGSGVLGTVLPSHAQAYNVTTGSVECADEVAWVSHIFGTTNWKEVPYTIKSFTDSPGIYWLEYPSNPLKTPYVLDTHMYVTQTASEAADLVYQAAWVGSPYPYTMRPYSGVDFSSGLPGSVQMGYASLRSLVAVDGSSFPTLGIASTYEVFISTPYSGWVKDFDLPIPVIAGNTEQHPMPTEFNWRTTGINYGGSRYFKKVTGYSVSELFSLSEYAYSAAVPSGLLAADELCPYSSGYVMYGGHRALRFKLHMQGSKSYQPSIFFSGVNDYDFTTDTNTLRAVDTALLSTPSVYDFTGAPWISCRPLLAGSKLYMPKNNLLTLEFDIVTGTATLVSDTAPTIPGLYSTALSNMTQDFEVPCCVTDSGDMFIGDTTNQGRAMYSVGAGCVLSSCGVDDTVGNNTSVLFATHF